MRIRSLLVSLMVVTALACTSAVPPPAAVPIGLDEYTWSKLPTEPYRGKQDDIFFLTPELGWYVNGSGKIYKTTDGARPERPVDSRLGSGATWTPVELGKVVNEIRVLRDGDDLVGYAIGVDIYKLERRPAAG
jgi:hypothetical protein